MVGKKQPLTLALILTVTLHIGLLYLLILASSMALTSAAAPTEDDIKAALAAAMNAMNIRDFFVFLRHSIFLKFSKLQSRGIGQEVHRRSQYGRSETC